MIHNNKNKKNNNTDGEGGHPATDERVQELRWAFVYFYDMPWYRIIKGLDDWGEPSGGGLLRRHMVIWFMRHHTQSTLNEIARTMKRSRTTVIRSLRHVQAKLATRERRYKEEIEKIERVIRSAAYRKAA